MTDNTPTLEVAREIRFAVVMYGGVSLAIYLNGVTQEMLQMASATAEDPANPGHPLYQDCEDTRATYRVLAQLLSLSSEQLCKCEAQMADSPDATVVASWLPNRITVKFIVDTISGTSAGGINGIFLGKALANNQTLDQLQEMWIHESDILKLINDKESISDLNSMPSPDPPTSLLNGQRMYLRLVQAFDAMDRNLPDKPSRSGYVDDLDVFATTTDVNGLPVYLRLADGIVCERRYKNVFHFKHRQTGTDVTSDFNKQMNPFLAYAARCTSSFPIAFAPMALNSIGDILVTMPEHINEQGLGTQIDRWQPYFPAYQPSTDAAPSKQNSAWYEFQNRPFCDGAYLNNKPFSYAIDMLSQRVSSRPVDRKLIYIEPDPEHPELSKEINQVPNPIENALLSQSLATYETIREDLERVLDRNLLIERVNRLLAGSDDDVNIWRAGEAFDDDKLFNTGDLNALIQKYGAAYGGYHRLKIGALTDEIGNWVGAAANFQKTSAYISGIALLVRAWREKIYPVKKILATSPSETHFLYEFDLSYRIRRLRFVIRRLDILRRAGMQSTPNPVTDASALFESMQRIVISQPAISADLEALRRQLHQALKILMEARDLLLKQSDDNPLAKLLADAKPDSTLLDRVLRARTFEERFSQAQLELQNPALMGLFDKVAEFLRKYVTVAVVQASKQARSALQASIDHAVGDAQQIMRQVQSFYLNYQGYDFVAFPVVYATNVGEELCTTEVIRISPADATTLINPANGDMRKKLAGTILMHFGAFLEQHWRRNDMLWGRLDGAERLIKSLLPQNCPKLTAALIRDAQLRILQKYFAPMNSNAILSYSAAVVGRMGPLNKETENLKDFLEAGVGTPGADQLNELVEATLRQSLGPQKLLAFFADKTGYQVSREPTPITSALAMSRATTVIGKILKKIGDDQQLSPAKQLGSWMARSGQVLWGLVEISMPGRLLRLLGHYWLKVAYALEILLILGGLLFSFSEAQKIGWAFLGLTVLGNAASWVLSDWFAGCTRALRILKLLTASVLGVLVAIGAYVVWMVIGDLR